MLLIVRSTYSATDGRVQNHLKSLQFLGCPITIIDWPRTKNDQLKAREMKMPNVISFTLISGMYGNFVKTLFGRIIFDLFVLAKIFKFRGKLKTIILSDLDTALLAVFIRTFFKGRIIFDIYDHYSDVFRENKFINYLENKCIHWSDNVIICAEWRRKILPIDVRNRAIVIENFSLLEAKVAKSNNAISNSIIKVLYIGVLQPKIRGLENLVQAVIESHNKVQLVIGGFGPLEDEFKSLNSSKIVFIGPVGHDETTKFINDCNVIVGFYYLNGALHHENAAPNKYYEHLKYGKAIITNVGPAFAKVVEQKSTGYVIEEGLVSMKNLIDNLELEDIKLKSSAALDLWPSFLTRNRQAYLSLINNN